MSSGRKIFCAYDGAGEFIFPQKEKDKGKRAADAFFPTKNLFDKPLSSAKAERN